jgi:hypothetical protein
MTKAACAAWVVAIRRRRAEALGYNDEGRLRGLGGSSLGSIKIVIALKFGQDGLVGVMDLLVEDVRSHLRHRSLADGESTIRSLPLEESSRRNSMGHSVGA